jgi:hypothetical protein
LRKSVIDFGKNLPPTLQKFATDFGKMSHRFGEIRFWEKHTPFLGRTGSVFGRNWLRFWEKTARFRGEIGSVFVLAWDKAQVSLS